MEQSTGSSEIVSDEKVASESNPEPSFKTPSFVISTKKKVKSNTAADSVFKPPDKPVEKTSVTSKDGKTQDQESEIGVEKIKSESSANIQKLEKESDTAINPQKVLSPAEQLKQSQAAVPYQEPPWSSICEDLYSFEVIKNGAIIDKIDLTTRCYHIVGRLPSCNIPMEHPSLSRHHAVIQYCGEDSEGRSKGWYLFDLDSTHGTWINKNKVPPQKFHRLHVDYVLKFGGSTRLFILQGPNSDREEESELSASEMKEQREKQMKEAELIRQAEIEEAERKEELLKKREDLKGCSWGIDEDEAVEEEDETAENPFAAIEPDNENLYINDPKKALNGYFEREGLDLPEYEFHEVGFGKWKCSVELPIDAPSGEPIMAEVTVSGKKREAVVACALEACRVLDRHGELRKAAQESRKRKGKNWEDDDFYDSDEDTYLDRTGAIEKKRELRKMKVGKNENTKTETYDSLMEKHKGILDEIQDIEGKLEHAKAQAAAMESDDVDALDAYMSAIKSGMMDTKTKMKLKRQLMELKQEEQKVRKLVNIAKPASLPELTIKSLQPDAKKSMLTTSVGKMKGPIGGKIVKRVVTTSKPEIKQDFENEIEEDEEETVEPMKGAEESKDSIDDAEKTINELAPEAKERNRTKPVKQIGALKQDLKETSKPPEGQKPIEGQSRLKGPTLPLSAVLEKLQEEADNADSKSSEKGDQSESRDSRRKRKSVDNESKGNKKSKAGLGYKDDDPDYAVWLPPDNQSGDGKTHLNDKLGY